MKKREIENEHKTPVQRIGRNGERLGEVATHTGSGIPLYYVLEAKGSKGRKKIVSIDEFHQKYIC